MKIDYENELNERQLEAVRTKDGPLLILAGAGSGKTRTLVYRVSYLIESGVNPHQILLLTFTNKAADEMKTRAENMLDDRCGEITACTYHSFCNSMLRRYGKAVGIEPDYTILSPADSIEIISRLKTEADMPRSRDFPSARKAQSIISAHVNTERSWSQCIAEQCSMSAMKYLSDIRKLASLFADYKDQQGLLDYDDMLTKFLKLLTDSPKTAKEISSSYKYIMVDEYQDTNRLQESIIFKMREDNHNLAVVGDDYQSIYKFRGSDVGNIVHFPDRMPDCKTVFLNINYRSTEEIVHFSNLLMTTNRAEGMRKEMKSTYTKNEKPRYVELVDQDDEIEFIISNIEKAYQRGVPYSDNAVLFRAGAQAAALEIELNQRGIPYDKYGGKKFLDRACVQDMVCLFRCIINPKDEIAWYRLLKLNPLIGKIRAGKISRLTAENGLDALIHNDYGNYKFMPDLTDMHDRILEMSRMDHEEMLEAASKYYIGLRNRQIDLMKTDDDTKQDLLDTLDNEAEDIQTLVQLASQYMSTEAFLDDVVLAPDAVQKESSDDKLILSTIHSAKGLEFDTVYLMDCLDGICPHTVVGCDTKEDDQEELRCFYVAVTRAKEHLYLLVPETVTLYGHTYTVPAHYLNGAVTAATDKRMITPV